MFCSKIVWNWVHKQKFAQSFRFELPGRFIDFKEKFFLRIDGQYTGYQTQLKSKQEIADFLSNPHLLSKSFNKTKFWNFEK